MRALPQVSSARSLRSTKSVAARTIARWQRATAVALLAGRPRAVGWAALGCAASVERATIRTPMRGPARADARAATAHDETCGRRRRIGARAPIAATVDLPERTMTPRSAACALRRRWARAP